MISNAKDICALSLWSFCDLSSKLLLQSFHFLDHISILLALFRHHIFVLVHNIFIFRCRIDIHGKRSFSDNVVHLRVELLDEFHLLSLIFHNLELKDVWLHCAFTEKVINFLHRFSFFLLIKSFLTSGQRKDNLFWRYRFEEILDCCPSYF
jgi:hypothetical protein